MPLNCRREVIVRKRRMTRPPPSTVSMVRARRLGVTASKSCKTTGVQSNQTSQEKQSKSLGAEWICLLQPEHIQSSCSATGCPNSTKTSQAPCNDPYFWKWSQSGACIKNKNSSASTFCCIASAWLCKTLLQQGFRIMSTSRLHFWFQAYQISAFHEHNKYTRC